MDVSELLPSLKDAQKVPPPLLMLPTPLKVTMDASELLPSPLDAQKDKLLPKTPPTPSNTETAGDPHENLM